MSVLSKLKIVALPPKSGLTPEQQRRGKVIAKLQEQLKLAEAALGGPAYERQRWGWATNENGDKVKVPRPIRIKTWWDETPAGAIQFGLRYGSAPLEIQKGKAAVEVGKGAHDPERRDREAVVAQERLLGDPVLRDRDAVGGGAHHAVPCQKAQAVGRHVLEFGRRTRAGGRQFAQRCIVEVIALQVAIGDATRRAVRARIEHGHPVAHRLRRHREHAAELAATEQAERRARSDHGFAGGSVIASTLRLSASR